MADAADVRATYKYGRIVSRLHGKDMMPGTEFPPPSKIVCDQKTAGRTRLRTIKHGDKPNGGLQMARELKKRAMEKHDIHMANRAHQAVKDSQDYERFKKETGREF